MAVRLRTAPRPGQIQNLLIAAAVAAAAIAIVPIVIAIAGGAAGVTAPRAAFASAPAGEYAVVSRSLGSEDVIAVVPADDPSHPREVARIAHVAGYAPVGAVSPDGHTLALVVADAGPQANPTASLVALDLDSGDIRRLATNADVLRPPVWALDSRSVVITRPATATDGRSAVLVIQVFLDGSPAKELLRTAHVLGAYPVGFDQRGRLVTVVIDSRGSTLVRDGNELGLLSSQVTRDWRLSPDGASLAFIESSLANGLEYRGRLVAIDAPGGQPAMTAQALTADGQQLGVAWRPGAGAPTFGEEPVPSPAVAGSVSAQALQSSPGFDVPIAYSPAGVLAVTHWTGAGFADAGRSALELVSPTGRAGLPGFARFFGWTQR